jgi:4-hydroxymandelate oxidase
MAEPRYLQVDDYEPVAKEKLLPADVYDYYAGGAGDERTLEENLRAFDRWVLRAGTVPVASSTAVDDLEQIAAASDGPKWWQLYLFADPGSSAEILGRVVRAGYEAICWTVDFPVGGLRRRDTRSGFLMPFGIGEADYVYEPNMTWDHLTFIREHAPGLPVLVKGILTAEDALLAVEHGAEGIVVFNHGGRQLDPCMASLDALPEVIEAVAGRLPVPMDGGIRRGTDVVKAIALGAAAVMVGRPAAWGLAAEGEDGVAGVLGILRAEVENAMALTGCRSIAEIRRELVAPAP